ncbi:MULTISPECIES: AraC family transcriptional regulator [unclassified Caballeronia]|uniref:helix-turn-helix transcriptional regulator n=1 Tax=unclassified Caballeronia TaxID=2646786 RepID=UPI0028600452|nr:MULTISPECIES: AraC family transcriptional regulator [unclassified Caballeronia]MDR5776034.1 AraC family transcriptional regulator [Caballeronia sp. LZ002]MDR5851474.1 AraC family transcriptional regulator [Caballeronia sp. LZ003]
MNAPVHRPGISLRRYEAVQATDEHDFHQIVLGFDGAMGMAVDGRESHIDRHRAWIIPAHARHEYWAEGVNRQLVLDLPATSVAVPERFFERARTVDLDSAMTQLVADIALNAGIHDGRFAWQAAAHLCGALMADAGASVAAEARGLDFARIDRWLRLHLSEPLRIADLAAHCGFGMRRFHQLFSEAFGETPHRYLHRLRLDTALALLADPRAALSDIALDVGFADQSAFTHAFSKRFGIAPGLWRNGLRAPDPRQH